jgi:hypothetical protein
MSTPLIVFSCCRVRITPAHINKPTYRQNLFGMGDGIISWWRTIFAPLPISSLFCFSLFARSSSWRNEKKKIVNPRHFAFPCRVVWPSCLSSPLYQTFESILLAKQLPVSVWHDCCHFPTAPPPLENVSKYSTYAFFQTKKG